MGSGYMEKDKNMKKKKQKASVSEKIMKIIGKQSMAADEIRQELKDKFGYPVKPEDVRVNLLYLLRRGKIKRKKVDTIYKYHI